MSNQSSGHFNDEYDLKEELGKGAFSIVRRCVKVRYSNIFYFCKKSNLLFAFYSINHVKVYDLYFIDPPNFTNNNH